jgi:glycerate 2-kinase
MTRFSYSGQWICRGRKGSSPLYVKNRSGAAVSQRWRMAKAPPKNCLSRAGFFLSGARGSSRLFGIMKNRPFAIAIAPDSFKGSLTAMEAADCIERGLKKALTAVRTVKIPMADGGDGTVQTVVDATGGRIATRTVRGPLGEPVRARFGLSGDGRTAVIEMAAASGLALLKPAQRNPLVTTTFGTGELIRHALKLKVRKILVGIGGSATNDGGTGMARALGVKFFDQAGRPLPEGGGALADLARIDASGRDPRLDGVTLEVACDVDNPLSGPRGASRVYGPQKGATPAMVRRLDRNLARLGRLVRRDLDLDILTVPGGGAAGGLGAGLMAFAGGVLRPGIDMVTDLVGLRRRIKGCDLVIVGEGRMDGQTAFGKAPAGVAKIAREQGIPVIAIAGSVGPDADRVHAVGIGAYAAAMETLMDESRLPREGPAMLERCATQVARLLALPLPSRERLILREP